MREVLVITGFSDGHFRHNLAVAKYSQETFSALTRPERRKVRRSNGRFPATRRARLPEHRWRRSRRGAGANPPQPQGDWVLPVSSDTGGEGRIFLRHCKPQGLSHRVIGFFQCRRTPGGGGSDFPASLQTTGAFYPPFSVGLHLEIDRSGSPRNGANGGGARFLSASRFRPSRGPQNHTPTLRRPVSTEGLRRTPSASRRRGGCRCSWSAHRHGA